jgi:hypothetical protein
MNINGEFASINGKLAIINGTPPLKAIVAASEAYPKGWHEGDVGGLSAIETNLAPANIKKTVNIFGKAGTFEQAVSTTELQATVSFPSTSGSVDVWKSKISKTVPAAAMQVQAYLVLRVSAGSTAQMRILYNGVEKAIDTGVGNTPEGLSWNGAGIGSEASLQFQEKANDINTISYGGAMYYQAPA